MTQIDQPKAIRCGEELDSLKIEKFIKDRIPGTQGQMFIQQFPRGSSNLTYLLTIGDREFVLRRPPIGTKTKTAHDMGREYRILSALQDTYHYAPKPLAYTEDASIIGCPFYVMERIRGTILRRDLPSDFNNQSDKVRKL
jgi:aminoglycoside phosphotransferase (APT) family kinase protein